MTVEATPKPAAPQPGTPEHDAAMVAKFDAAAPVVETPAAPEAPQRPAHVPEKFWNAETGAVDMEAWAKSYTELEQKQSQGKPDAKPDEPAKAPDVDPAKATTDEAAAALESKGLDMSTFSAEFAEKGELTADSYAALKKAGIPKAMVDTYIAGQQAIVERQTQEAYEVAGGKEQFSQMTNWAVQNLSPGEIEAFNSAVSGASLDQAKLAISGLRARYEAKNGREPGLLGGTPSNGASAGYASRAEMTADMSNPQYAKDPAFRARVAAKLGNTNAF